MLIKFDGVHLEMKGNGAEIANGIEEIMRAFYLGLKKENPEIADRVFNEICEGFKIENEVNTSDAKDLNREIERALEELTKLMEEMRNGK